MNYSAGELSFSGDIAKTNETESELSNLTKYYDNVEIKLKSCIEEIRAKSGVKAVPSF